MRKVLLLSASDRFNYGDLLFPLIVKMKLQQYFIKDKVIIDNYSLVDSDLSSIGALSTKKYSDLKKSLVNDKNTHLILIGGDVLGANWFSLYSNIHKSLQILLKLRLYRLLNCFFKPQLKFPFIINKNQFSELRSISYNSVGGNLSNKSEYDYIKTADYIAVRSSNIYEKLKNKNINAYLYPDTASVMSEIWPLEKLEGLRNSHNIYPEKFIFFQVSLSFFSNNKQNIITELTKLYEITKLDIVLCPIGLANGHEDQIALKKLKEALEIPCILIQNPSIWDIMYSIAKSDLYIGTSLHGVITAMSFSKPYIGLNIPKLYNYLKTWAISELSTATNSDEISSKSLKILKDQTLEGTLIKASKQLILQSNKTIDNICKIIEKNGK